MAPARSSARLRALRACLALIAAVTVVMLGTAAFSAGPSRAAGGQAAAGHSEQASVVHAVLFYSPTCAHCRELIRIGLPPILRHYGDRLQVLAVDAATQPGAGLFAAAVRRYHVPAASRGVPAVVLGDRFIAGSTSITMEVPALVDQQLGRGGVEWPDLPGLSSLRSAAGSVVATSSSELLAATERRPDGVFDRLARDRWGNSAALVLLAGMAAVLGLVSLRLTASRRVRTSSAASSSARGKRPAMALLIAAGLGISGYLSYAAATGSAVLCASLTSCDVVQHSAYARLLGIPVAYLGVAGYILAAAAFLVSIATHGKAARAADFALLGLTLAGTAFSFYLTVLEPLFLGAACLWCLGSATVMTLLLLLSADRVGLLGRQARAVEGPTAGATATHVGSHAG